MICAGIAVIACCLLIPAADENRRLAYERERLKRDLEHLQKQVHVNDEFLKRVSVGDASLMEYLAQGQMKLVREGTRVLKLNDNRTDDRFSPYKLVTLAPPPELAEYRPVGGIFSEWCRHPRSRLLLMGTGMLAIAVGLVMGAADPRVKT